MTVELSPEEFRKLGYRAVDLLAARLVQIKDTPARPYMPDSSRDHLLQQPPPESGGDPAAILESIAQHVLPYPMGNASPRFFAWVNSPPAPLGVLAELLAAGHNPSSAGGHQSATYVEHAVLNWLKAIIGYPQDSAGLLVTGGSAANLHGLAVMRHVKTNRQVREGGLQGGLPPLVVYTSTQGHSCIQKSIELLGIGSKFLRRIAVDKAYRMDIDALRRQIQSDREGGLMPACVAASAGTVNTGAIDPLDELADLCAAEKLWLHVDGAYGGVGVLAEAVRPLYKGLERADSLAIDPHKWLYVPVECGCVLVRDAAAMRETFSLVPPYLRDNHDLPWFSEFGFQQTRGFKALKLWAVLQQVGVEGYRKLISRDIGLARKLQEKIKARTDFELVAAGELSITCFRYAPMGAGDLNDLNRRLLAEVQREGEVYITGTDLDGRHVIRACIVNFRTQESDLDFLLDRLAAAGQRVINKA